MKEERVIDRMMKFADWCKKGNLCKSKSDFERICGLTHNYLYNSTINTKSNIGVEAIAKIHKQDSSNEIAYKCFTTKEKETWKSRNYLKTTLRRRGYKIPHLPLKPRNRRKNGGSFFR